MEGGAPPFPEIAAIAFPDLKRYPLIAGLTEKVFQSSHGEAQRRTHDLAATFYTITEPL